MSAPPVSRKIKSLGFPLSQHGGPFPNHSAATLMFATLPAYLSACQGKNGRTDRFILKEQNFPSKKTIPLLPPSFTPRPTLKTV